MNPKTSFPTPGPRFKGAAVLVTGAGSGLGRAIAHRFASEGAAAVAIIDRDPGRVESVAREVAELGASPVPLIADLADPAANVTVVDEAAAAMGGISVAIANAALSSGGEPSLDLELESWNRMLAVNLTGYFLIARHAARHMVRSGGGVILFTASVGGTWGQPGGAHYSVTKAGVINLAKTLALEWGHLGIRVNAVSPGGMDTNMVAEYQGEAAAERQRTGPVQAVTGRIAQAWEVAAAFAFLASADGAYITGTNLFVDGGVSAGIPPRAQPT